MTSSAEHLPHLATLQRTCTELATADDDRFTVGKVGDTLNKLLKESEDDDDLRALAVAFSYVMNNSKGYRSSLDDAEDAQPLSEGPFGPMFELKNSENEWVISPPAPRRLLTATLDVWVKYAQEPVLHPLLRARLADLLWVRKHEQQHRWHEIAVGAYIELVDHPEIQALERERAVIRAVNLSRESRQTSLEQSAWDALNRFVAMLLKEDGGHYGPMARCVDHLVTHGQPCDELVDRAISRYNTDPHSHMQLWQIKAQAANSQAERERSITEAINILIADADSSPGLRQLALLRDAWALAQREGLTELMSDLEARIARVDVEDGFTTFEAEVEVSREEIEAMLQEIIGDADELRDALIAFGRHIPIQSEERNQQEAVALIEAAPIQHLARRMSIATVADQIAVTDIPSSQESASMEIEVRQIERHQIELSALLIGCNVLREIDRRHTPTLQALVEHFCCVLISEDLARRIAKSYLHWRQGDQDSAVSVIILTIEAVIRRLAGAIDITVTQIKPGSNGQRVGEAVTLGRLLESIADHPAFENVPIISRYLDSALTNRWSLNLRNLLTHSLTSLTEEQYAVLFHIVCLLRCLADNFQQSDDATQ